ncbi:glutaredoxin 2 [Dongshaea marina]|uniref:glutaredoxin 2 n=1 Tax=Dongshaea marina TaxID=2047966 RepID=UPI00131EFAC9|nr:glutaredoxin 2 [Dongshaea marina]
MKLYLFDHCPYCIKAQMAIGINRLYIELVYLDNDDVRHREAMVGRNTVPILEKYNGNWMAESLDIARYLDEYCEPVRIDDSHKKEEVAEWLDHIQKPMNCLTMPRFVKMDLPEFQTPSAIRWYTSNKEAMIECSFEDAMRYTDRYKGHAEATLSMLDWLKPPAERNNVIGWDDFEIFPFLRNLTCVKDFKFPANLEQYLDQMSKLTRIPLYQDRAI